MTKPIIIKPTSHEEWLKAREDGIGASEVAAIVGLSPWETPFSLWLRKTGQVPPLAETEAMHMGHLLEEVVATLWSERTGWRVVKASAKDIIYRDAEHPWRFCTPDRYAYEVDADTGKRSKVLIECKTSSMGFDPDDLPVNYLAQCQYQMHITGIHVCYLCWLVNGRSFGYARLEYDAAFAEWLVTEVDKFWFECVKGGKEPELITVSDFAFKGSKEGSTIEADSAALERIAELRETSASRAELEAKEEALKDNLKLFMGESEALVSKGCILATWKSGKKGRQFLLKKQKEAVAEDA